MSAMSCHVLTLELPGSSGADIHDVTPQVLAAASQDGGRTGWVMAVASHRRRRVAVQVLGG